MKLFPICNFQGISFLILPCVEAQKSNRDIACVLDIGGYIFFFFSFLMWVYLLSSSYVVGGGEKKAFILLLFTVIWVFSLWGRMKLKPSLHHLYIKAHLYHFLALFIPPSFILLESITANKSGYKLAQLRCFQKSSWGKDKFTLTQRIWASEGMWFVKLGAFLMLRVAGRVLQDT